MIRVRTRNFVVFHPCFNPIAGQCTLQSKYTKRLQGFPINYLQPCKLHVIVIGVFIVPARILLIFSSVDLTDSCSHKYQGLKFWDENLRVEI